MAFHRHSLCIEWLADELYQLNKCCPLYQDQFVDDYPINDRGNNDAPGFGNYTHRIYQTLIYTDHRL